MPRELSEIVAYHEAGHAVMAMANGFSVTKISSVSNGNILGHVAWQYPSLSTTRSRIGAVLVSSAGMAADFIYWNERGADEMEEPNGYRTDRIEADVCLRELEEDGQFDVYCAIAVQFLRRSDVWDWVKIFAELISTAGEIHGRDFLHRAYVNVPKFGDDDLIRLRRALSLPRQDNIE